MYQGKFDAKSRGQKASGENLQSILEARNAAKEAQAARQAARRPAPRQTAAAQQAAPAARPVPQPRRAAPQPVPQPAPQPEVKAKRRGPRVGGVIFYTLYFLFIFLFFGATFLVLQWLNGWLGDYEAAQPTVKCQEVFEELFGDPNWEQLYYAAGIQDTEYEGVEQFVAYMEEKVDGQELDFVETSAGLSGDKKYIVRLNGSEKIATFTLEGKSESITDIPDWQKGQVELFFQRQKGTLIQKVDGHKAFVNGVELSDDYTIQIATTKMEEYLPIGTAGVRICTQQIDGLLQMPEVKITNAAGEEMVVIYDTENNIYAEQTVSSVIGDEEKAAALGALRSWAEFMINAAGSRVAVSKYFDSGSQVYSDIVKMAGELWMNADNGHSFTQEELSGYTRISDELFSVHGLVNMHVICKDGSEKDYAIEKSLFFRLKNGNWVCYDATNEDVTQAVGRVRLTFKDTSGNVLSSEFYDTNATQLNTPVISVPDGKAFSGWVRQDIAEDGSTTLTVVFVPDENGLVNLSSGVNLEPMTLFPLIETAENGGQNG